MSELTFEKPAPGSWEQDPAHFTRPFSRWMLEIYPDAFERGFKKMSKIYGLLVHPQVESVNGFIYTCIRAVGAPAEPSGPPPKFLFKLMSWFHPTVRSRFSKMEQTFRQKRWREDLNRWDEEWKPQIIDKNEQLQAVNPSDLSDEALIEHVDDCRETLRRGLFLHHRLNGCWMLPLGDFLAQVREWTDLTAADLMALFKGASAVSLGALEELQRAVDSIREHDEARRILWSNQSPGRIIDRLSDEDSPVCETVNSWLEVVGHRIISGYDVGDPSALETPAVLVKTLRTAVEHGVDEVGQQTSDAELESIRQRVPDDRLGQFDELYEEARLTYRVRDERTYLNDFWTGGLTRRALLEVGKRLTARDKLEEKTHAVDVEHDDLVGLLRDGEGPSAEEVAQRARLRQTLTYEDAPDRLGPEPAPPPPVEWMPEPAARGMKAVLTMIETAMESHSENSTDEEIRGLSASPGSYRGRARVISGPEDFSRIEEGDVLVATCTTPTFNVILPMLGGIVTDRGGVLSHAAIVAREYGIPGVVGCRDATDKVEDGMPVVLDGESGTVRVAS